MEIFLLGIFNVVEFTKDRTVSMIPDLWFINDVKCVWPKRNVAVACEERTQPKSDWTVYDIRLLGSAGIHSYACL
jgi:hypothetical protein